MPSRISLSHGRKRPFLAGAALAGLAVGFVLAAAPAGAGDRSGARHAVRVAPDLAAEWILQLSPGSGVVPGYRRPHLDRPAPAYGGAVYRAPVAVAVAVERRPAAESRPRTRIDVLDPVFLPQVVEYKTTQAPGTIVIDTKSKFLYLVQEGGTARRYGVGVGKEGFEWSGTQKVTRKKEWPTWTPPSQMRAREKKKGRILPARMEGGPDNPLGARAMYLGSTLYRIHGTNQPWTIGKAVSSGCIRMRNEDVTELYEQVRLGTRVVVL